MHDLLLVINSNIHIALTLFLYAIRLECLWEPWHKMEVWGQLHTLVGLFSLLKQDQLGGSPNLLSSEYGKLFPRR
jgi:hypothetical protein